jgi:hypothetical protein
MPPRHRQAQSDATTAPINNRCGGASRWVKIEPGMNRQRRKPASWFLKDGGSIARPFKRSNAARE